MVRRLILVLVCMALSACDGGSAPKPAASPATTTTTVATTTTSTSLPAATTTTLAPKTSVILVPYPSQLSVTQTREDECTASHLDYYRPTAFLCWGTGDPCFADPSGASELLLCVTDPHDGTAIAVTPTSLDDSARPPLESGTPWVLDLVNGEHCGFVGGGTSAIDDMRANYSCPSGWLYGDPDRSSGQWTILLQPTGTQGLTSVAIAAAYY